MKHTFFCLLLLFVGYPAFGQIQDYRAYQQSIHVAELHLVRGEKEDALNKYQEVLISDQGNFVKDVYNALLLANELEETGCFFELLELLLPKNLDNGYLKGFAAFSNRHSDARWAAFLAANEQTEIPEPALKATLVQLAKDDQYFRVKDGSYDVYGDTIKEIDNINIAILLDLIANDRFPGEAKIGVEDIRGKQPTDIIFHHYSQLTSVEQQKRVITPELISLVQAGKVLPNKCGLWLDMQKGQFSVGVFDLLSIKINGKRSDWYVPILSKEELVLVEQRRQLLGMEPLEDYYEKTRFYLANQEAGYIFDVRTSVFDGNQAVLEAMTEGMRKL